MDDQKPNLEGSSPEPDILSIRGSELTPPQPPLDEVEPEQDLPFRVKNTDEAVRLILEAHTSQSEERGSPNTPQHRGQAREGPSIRPTVFPRRKAIWFAFAAIVVTATGMLLALSSSMLTMYVPREKQALPSPVSKNPPSLRPEPKAEKITWPTDGDGSLEVFGVPVEYEGETWSGPVAKIDLRYKQFGIFESINDPSLHLARARYVNGKIVSLTLPDVTFQLTNKANNVRDNNYSLAMTLQATVEVASGRAILFPTHFQLRLPRGELTRYVKDHIRPIELQILGLKFRWSIHDSELHFDRRPIACKMEVDIEVWDAKKGREPLFQARARLAGESEYNLKRADHAQKQQLDFALRIASIQMDSLPSMDAVFLKSILEIPVHTYPFRDADKPLKSLVEHVTVHNFGISPSDDNAEELLLQASCTRRTTRP